MVLQFLELRLGLNFAWKLDSKTSERMASCSVQLVVKLKDVNWEMQLMIYHYQDDLKLRVSMAIMFVILVMALLKGNSTKDTRK